MNRKEMKAYVMGHPQFLRRERIVGGPMLGWVFKYRTCVGLTEAFAYAKSLKERP